MIWAEFSITLDIYSAPTWRRDGRRSKRLSQEASWGSSRVVASELSGAIPTNPPSESLRTVGACLVLQVLVFAEGELRLCDFWLWQINCIYLKTLSGC